MRKMKDSGVEWIGEIPEGKELLRNKYGVLFCKGKIPSSTNDESIGMPYIGASDLDSESPCNVFTDDNTIPKCEREDTLILWDGARAGLVGTGKKGCISSTVVSTQCSYLQKEYWFWYCKGFEWFFLENVGGTTIPHMNKRFIYDIGYINFSISEQEDICKHLKEKTLVIESLITNEETQIEKLKAYKQSLITEVVTKGLDPNVTMKDSGVELIGMIPQKWSVSRLRNIGVPQNGISKGGEFFGEGYPFVSYGDVYKNFVLPYDVKGLVKSSPEEQQNYSVEQGDIFFTRTSETIDEVGFSCVCEKTIPKATFAGFLIRVRPFNKALNSGYAKYYFRSNHLRTFLAKEMNIVIRASLGQNLLKNIPVLIPSEQEQIEIAKYLDEKCAQIDHLISIKQQKIEKLNQYKKSLIYEYVTGKKEVI